MHQAHRILLGVVSVVVVGLVVAWANITPAAGQAQAGAQAPLSAAAAALHKEAIVVDGHVHIETSVLHQHLDPWKVQETGLFDYARAKQGGVDVVVHAIYTEDAYNNYNYGVKQVLRLLETFYRVLEANQDKMELALTSADVRRIVGKGKIAAVLALEGMPDMEGDLEVLRILYRLGVRMIEFTSHDTTSALTDAWRDERKWGGISDRGRAMIREMNRLGIIIDIAHASDEAMAQIIAASQAPVANSHRALQRFPSQMEGGTMSAERFKALAAKGGILALNQRAGVTKAYDEWQGHHPRPTRYGPDGSGTFLSGGRLATLALPNKGIRPPDKDYGAYFAALDAEMHDNWAREQTAKRGGTGFGTPWRVHQARLLEAGEPMLTAADWVEHAAYAIELSGEDNVGIGLDMLSAPTMRDFDARGYGLFTEAMLAKGMSPGTIKKVLGENWLRLLDQAKVPGLTSPDRPLR